MASDALRWTINELNERAAAALVTTDYDPPPNRQVRPVPDLRTVRYYMSLGLLDPPLELRGRVGLYGRRHLLQLVAIKRLQQDGLSLTDIQTRLAGVDERGLAKLAQVPPGLLAGEAPDVVMAPALREAQPFWAASPVLMAEPELARSVAPAAATRAESAASPTAARDRLAAPRAAPAPATVTPNAALAAATGKSGPPPVWVAKVRLAPGVELHVETRARLDADALRRAAAPLLEQLRRSSKKEE